MIISEKVGKYNHFTDFIRWSQYVFLCIKIHMQSHSHSKNNLKRTKFRLGTMENMTVAFIIPN